MRIAAGHAEMAWRKHNETLKPARACENIKYHLHAYPSGGALKTLAKRGEAVVAHNIGSIARLKIEKRIFAILREALECKNVNIVYL